MQQKINKKKIITYLFLTLFFMFFFKSSIKANYEKSFYDISVKSIEGHSMNLNDFKGKVILLVNVASYCGFTKQYSDLQYLWDNYKDIGLVVLGVPSQSFNQEKKSEKEVKDFCEVNFSINFPMTSILKVKGKDAHDIYKWAKLSYGKSAVPKWNFHKILINRNGKIIDTYASFTNPKSKKIVSKIEKLLN